MFRVLLFLALLFPALCSAQVDTTGIFKKVSRLRLPSHKQVDSMITQLNRMPGIKLDTQCLHKTEGMLDKYRSEDIRQQKKLTNQAASYATGWREKIPGRCGAGGPPPICPVDHWYRADIGVAMAEFHSIHQEVLKQRLDKIWRAMDSCILERPMKVEMIKENIPPPEKNNGPGDFKVEMLK